MGLQRVGRDLAIEQQQVVMLVVKNSPANAGNVKYMNLIWVWKIPWILQGQGHGKLLQYSSLENPLDRGA